MRIPSQAERGLPDRVLASWERSRAHGLRRDRDVAPPSEPVGSAAVLAAADEIADELATSLRGKPVAIVLADGRGRILDRRGGGSALAAQLDGVGAASGFAWRERHVGTNAIGIVVETGEAAAVAGREHYALSLMHLGSVAAPVRDPAGRLSGIVALLTWASADQVPLLAAVRMAARAVEGRLAASGRRRGPAACAPASAGRQQTFVGRSACAERLREECRLLAGRSVPICIVGEPGTGKATLARQLVAEAAAPAGRLTVDAAACVRVDPQLLIARVAATLVRGGTVTVLHVEWIAEPTRQRLAELALSVPGRAATLVMTKRAVPGPHTGDLLPVPAGAVELRVPPLREHVEDVQDLVSVFLARHDSRLRLTPDALDALARHEWPGNAREVEALVSELVARVGSGEVTEHDVPARYRGAGRRLGRMEQLEREAIVGALQEADGNKSRAAELLGIGRATLYRKLAAFDLAAGA